MFARFTARVTEYWQSPATALERGKTALQQANIHQQNQEFEQAQSFLNTAKAALKHGVPSEKAAESRPLLGEVYQKQAELLQRQKGFDIDAVRARYAKALEYFSASVDPAILACKAEVQKNLDCLPYSSSARRIKREATISPSSVTPSNPVKSTGIPTPFFVDPAPAISGLSHPSYLLVEPAQITDTQHLAWCLQQKTDKGSLEQERQHQVAELVPLILKQFKKADKNQAYMQEIAALATIEQVEWYEELLALTLEALQPSHDILNVAAVHGLVVIVWNCPATLLKNDGGVRAATWSSVLEALLTRLKRVLKSDTPSVQELLEAISQILDAMVQAGVTGISRMDLQQPLQTLLRDEKKLNPNEDAALSWQIRYAREALAYIPNDESRMDSVLRCLFSVGKGALNLAHAIKNAQVESLVESFNNLDEAFMAAKEIAGHVISGDEQFKELKEAVQQVMEAGSLLGEVQSDFQNRQSRKGWYVALQCIEPLIQANELVKFETLVRESAYRQNADFLQGVCQCLERLVRPEQDKAIQRKAIKFLKSLRDHTASWMKEEGEGGRGVIRVKEHAKAILARLEARKNSSDASTNKYMPPAWDQSWDKQLPTNLLRTAYKKLDIPLEQQVLKLLRTNIEKLRTTYIAGLQQDNEIRDALAHYVAPEGALINASNHEVENCFDLNEKVNGFLQQDTKQVLLLLGKAGLGKSTFNQHLARNLWEEYIANPKGAPIPVFIALSSVENLSLNLVTTFFESRGFSKDQLEKLRATQRLVFILDGFDEIKQPERAFYLDNQLEHWPKAKVIITSRPEYLGAGYQSKFHPPGQPEALQEWQLAPFSERLIGQYIDKYKAAHPASPLTAEHYKEALKQPDLSALVSTPFLLKMALSVLSEFGEGHQAGKLPFTRIALYDQFMQNWFGRSQRRLAQIKLAETERAEFQKMDRSGFAIFGMRFSKQFATALYRAGEVGTTYVDADASWGKEDATSQQSDWRREFLGDDKPRTVLMRLNAPLIRQGDKYLFIHKSVRDYFVAQAIWGPDQRRQEVDKTALLNELYLVEDPAVIDFLVERVQQEPLFKEYLLDFIKYSKQEDVQIAAANAITILVKAGLQFNNVDLQGIRIPRADLSFGVFDSAEFLGADLSGTNLFGTWLCNASLNGANLDGIYFGEHPYIQLNNPAKAFSYSYDKKWLAIGDESGAIELYSVNNFMHKKHRILHGHLNRVQSVKFSYDNKYLVSGSYDNSIRLWHIDDVKKDFGVIGKHTDKVVSVTFTRDNKKIISGSYDKSVKIWDISSLLENENRTEINNLKNFTISHDEQIEYVALSFDDRWLAFSSNNAKVRLFDLLNSKKEIELKNKHTGPVVSLDFANKNLKLISASHDQTLQLWDIETNEDGSIEAPKILKGHDAEVTSVEFSPDDTLICSGGLDGRIQIWDVNSLDKPIYTLDSNTRSVKKLAFVDNHNVAFSSYENNLKLREINTSALYSHAVNRHTHWIKKLAFSSTGKYLASGDLHGRIRIWDANNLIIPPFIISEKFSHITDMAFSIGDEFLISSGKEIRTSQHNMGKESNEYNTVKLWKRNHTNYKFIREFDDYTREVIGLAWLSREEFITISCDGKILKININHESIKIIRDADFHTDQVKSVTYHENGILIFGKGNSVQILNIKMPEEPYKYFDKHAYEVTRVASSKNSKLFASGDQGGIIYLCKTEGDNQELYEFKEHKGSIESLTFSSDGKILFSSAADYKICFWDTESGRHLGTIQNRQGLVYALAAHSKDLLFTAGEDKIVRLWQLVVYEEGKYYLKLHSAAQQSALDAHNMTFEGAKNLSQENYYLLMQRGAQKPIINNIEASIDNEVSLLDFQNKSSNTVNVIV